MVRKGIHIDCADGKILRWFTVLSAWIADHTENLALHVVKSNYCPKCKVIPWQLGKDDKYLARDYTEYEYCEGENGHQAHGLDSDDGANAAVTLDTLRINIKPGVFHGLYRVLAPYRGCLICPIQ